MIVPGSFWHFMHFIVLASITGTRLARLRLAPVNQLLAAPACVPQCRALFSDTLGCSLSIGRIHLADVSHAAQARFDAHHGNFGRGKDQWVLDCRHFCTPVVDVWNQVFYNLLC